MATYERAGVLEYVVLDPKGGGVHRFRREAERFVTLGRDEDGLFRSRAFPGLWLDLDALTANDKPRLVAALDRGLASPEHAAFVAELLRRRAGGPFPEESSIGSGPRMAPARRA